MTKIYCNLKNMFFSPFYRKHSVTKSVEKVEMFKKWRFHNIFLCITTKTKYYKETASHKKKIGEI